MTANLLLHLHNMEELSQAAREFVLGTYRHFKGQIVEALYLARDSEDESKAWVVYRHNDNGVVWVRPLEMFMENVEKPNYNGPRFTLVEEA